MTRGPGDEVVKEKTIINETKYKRHHTKQKLELKKIKKKPRDEMQNSRNRNRNRYQKQQI